MVCGDELELSTAQRDVASDWIAAYKKYFHTDRPLSLYSRLDSFSDFLELTPSRVKRSDAAKVILLSLPAKGFGKKKKGLRTPSGIESRQEFRPDHASAFGRRTQRYRGREGFGESRDLQH